MSPKERDPTPASTLKKCVMCDGEINQIARKCLHCGSYQSWLGQLNITGIILSLLVALVAVVSAAVQPIRALLTPTVATYRFSEPEILQGSISVIATNIGAETGVIDFAVVYVPQRRPAQPYIYVLEAIGSPESHEIRPGGARRLTFTFDHRRYNQIPVLGADSPCGLEIGDSIKQISCDEARFLSGTREPDRQSRRAGELPEEGPATLSQPSRWVRYPAVR